MACVCALSQLITTHVVATQAKAFLREIPDDTAKASFVINVEDPSQDERQTVRPRRPCREGEIQFSTERSDKEYFRGTVSFTVNVDIHVILLGFGCFSQEVKLIVNQ